jgi:EmrB/QacA subfamily drug resistance transporter
VRETSQRPRSLLEGPLEGIGLARLVGFFAELEKSGTLHIWQGPWVGQVGFDSGRLVAAAFRDERGRDAVDAIALALADGAFAFVEGPAPSVRNVRLGHGQLQRRLRRLETIGRAFGGEPHLLAAVPEVVDGGWADSDPAVALDRAALRLLLAIDGRLTVADLAVSVGAARTITALATLADLGLIRMRQSAAPSGPAVPAVLADAAGHVRDAAPTNGAIAFVPQGPQVASTNGRSADVARRFLPLRVGALGGAVAVPRVDGRSPLVGAPVPTAAGTALPIPIEMGAHEIQAPPPRPLALSRRQVRLTVVGLLLATFVSALDQTVVGTAMPRIIAELQGFQRYAWVTTAYLLTSTLGVPVFGKLSDQFGRKYLYLAGIVIFLIGSWLCGIARTMDELIAFRAIQGVGAGINQGLSFAILGDIFPPARRARAQGVFGAVFALASVLGPTLGGWLTDNLSWRWSFYVNVPVGLAALAMLWRFFPAFKPDAGARRRVDWPGITLLLGGTTPFLLAISLGGDDHAWRSPLVVSLFAAAAVLLAAFVLVEARQARRGGEPVLPLELFREPIYTVSIVTTVIVAFAMFGTLLYIPLFIQGVLGASATRSGAALWPLIFSLLVANVATGHLIARTGRYKPFGVAGLALVTLGMLLLSRMTGETGYWSAARNMVATGAGIGMTMPVFTVAVQNAVPYRVMGIAMGSLQFFRTLGGLIGVATLGTLMTSTFRPEFEQRAASALAQIAQVAPSATSPAPAAGEVDSALTVFTHPQTLLSPEALPRLRQTFAALPGGEAILEQLLAALRSSLAVALARVFLTGSIVLLAGLLVSLLLRERPLAPNR